MPEVHALPAEGIRAQATSDRRAGILHFQRKQPDAQGSHELNVAVPAPLLPYVAAAVLEIIPHTDQGGGGSQPFVMAAKTAQVDLAANGAMVLTIEMEMGARLSFSVDERQAAGLQQTISIALGRLKARALRAVRLPRTH